MAQPTKYEKETDFINQTYASSLPALDKEFTNVETSINEIRANLQMFQNDDATGLKSGIIKQDSLDSGIIQYLKGVASQTAGVAETNASNALVVAGNALRDASDAKQQASSANATANDAKNVALGAVEQISESITTVNNAVTELSEYKTETDATLSAYEGRVNSAIAAINPTITNKFGDFTGYTDTNSDGTVTVVEAVKQEVAKQVVERQNLTGDSIATALGYTPANDSSLATVAKTGSYNDLSNVPSTFAPSSHTHTQSQISDFPVLADVATSGSYSDLSNKPTKVSSFTNDAGYLTQHQSLANYLPLSGGTVTGKVTFSIAGAITRNSNTNLLAIGGGTGVTYGSKSGALLQLYGSDNADAAFKGSFRVAAIDANNNNTLFGTPSGSLKWGNNEVLTTANGLSLSGGTMTGVVNFASGQTIAGYLPLSGGAMSGTIHCSATALDKSADNSYLEIRGATSWQKGAYCGFVGKDCTDKTAGSFYLVTNNGSGSKTFEGKPSGSLTWNGNNISAMCLPSSTSTSLTLPATNGTLTMPADGWLYVDKNATAAGQYMTLIGTSAPSSFAVAHANGNRLRVFLPVRKNESVQFTYNLGGTTNYCTFYYAIGSTWEKA